MIPTPCQRSTRGRSAAAATQRLAAPTAAERPQAWYRPAEEAKVWTAIG
jgi:hypothetical protein